MPATRGEGYKFEKRLNFQGWKHLFGRIHAVNRNPFTVNPAPINAVLVDTRLGETLL